ncbi:uncharacterized protein M421DRAFT_423113 [Didymella exigua CBS 183.55]|uniref:Essential protein Yae1 N-terminal domain-containing protein n=1 Tax=Didymella exigua CBS 183.55 TaxID=1150837 RepID=A0A6A5RFQ6_9PLEO|nr:uncharacterized protein M421DRAFT_423113 [Didymella exigua CBS 183.55]KAF1926120.1 hypothetical protein M421DRAFT_423113 [Didymella exigua CBS 183.55]
MAPPINDDPFDSLLTLEDTLYTTAHSQGVADGARAGRIEGRIFGLEKGFEKFSALGALHGRGAVWGGRLASSSHSLQPALTASSSATDTPPSNPAAQPPRLPALQTPSARLVSNTTLLYHLTDPSTFSTSNTEAAVADYDDRFKRAGAKAKVIERIVEESPAVRESTPRAGKSLRVHGEAAKRGGKGDDSMEDFVGSRLIG